MHEPVFIHAWWRSSSTYVWSKLRQDPSLCCYYEPLHEEIVQLRSGTQPLADSVLLRHPAADKNYFAEYAEFGKPGPETFEAELAYDRYLLHPSQDDPALAAYLTELISQAQGAARTPVLCFCRSPMRSAWMRDRFGGHHAAQIRNPRDQWASFQVTSYFTPRMLVIASNLQREYPAAFRHIADFPPRQAEAAAVVEGAEAVAAAEAAVAPEGPRTSDHDASRVFALLWLASALQSISTSSFVLDADRLAVDAPYRAQASRWFAAAGCKAGFEDCATPVTAPPAAGTPDAFQAVLDEAVHAIRTHAADLVVCDRRQVEAKLHLLGGANAALVARCL